MCVCVCVCVCVINQAGRSIPFTIRILSTYIDLGLAIQATHGPLQQISTLAWIDQATWANSSIASTLGLKGSQAANINHNPP